VLRFDLNSQRELRVLNPQRSDSLNEIQMKRTEVSLRVELMKVVRGQMLGVDLQDCPRYFEGIEDQFVLRDVHHVVIRVGDCLREQGLLRSHLKTLFQG
jgi:hypothetical protein